MSGQSSPGREEHSTPWLDGPLRTIGACLVLCIAVLLAFANGLGGAFLFDDLHAIPENTSIRNLADLGAVLSAPPGSTVSRRPILNLSLAINYALGGLDVRGYHWANLVIHLAAAVTLYGIVRRTLTADGMPRTQAGRSTGLALAVALIWAVHPLQTSSVTYVIQRAESLMSFFYLLVFYCLIRGAGSRRPWVWYAAGSVSCGLGMATKEVMVTAPLLALIYDRIFLSRSWSEVWERRRSFHLLLFCTWVILGVVASRDLDRNNTIGFQLPFPWWQYALTQFGVLARYLRLSVWPSPLILDYDWPIASSAARIVPPALFIVALVGLTVWALVRKPKLGFLGAWFFIILAPSSSVIPLIDPIFEHRIRLSLASVACLFVLGASFLLEELTGRAPIAGGGRRGRILGVGALVATVVVLGTLTFLRNRDYRTEESIWRDTIEKQPTNARAYDFLGSALSRAGNLPEAIRMQTEALRLRPDWLNTYYNRGNAYLRADMCREAIIDYTAYLRSRKDPNALNNRALCYLRLGEYDKSWADVDSIRLLGFSPRPQLIQLLFEATGRTQ